MDENVLDAVWCEIGGRRAGNAMRALLDYPTPGLEPVDELACLIGEKCPTETIGCALGAIVSGSCRADGSPACPPAIFGRIFVAAAVPQLAIVTALGYFLERAASIQLPVEAIIRDRGEPHGFKRADEPRFELAAGNRALRVIAHDLIALLWGRARSGGSNGAVHSRLRSPVIVRSDNVGAGDFDPRVKGDVGAADPG